MKHFTTTITDTVAILAINRPPTHALSSEAISEFKEALSVLEQNTEVHAVVITGTGNKIFSFGFDLPEIIHFNQQEFAAFYNSFNELCLQMYTYPKPLVAAINGYAIAGGCIIALCCDHRLMSNGKCSMGVNEVKLGANVPWAATIILEQITGPRYTEEAILTGRLYTPDELLERGMVDELHHPDELQKAAIEKANTLGRIITLHTGI